MSLKKIFLFLLAAAAALSFGPTLRAQYPGSPHLPTLEDLNREPPLNQNDIELMIKFTKIHSDTKKAEKDSGRVRTQQKMEIVNKFLADNNLSFTRFTLIFDKIPAVMATLDDPPNLPSAKTHPPYMVPSREEIRLLKSNYKKLYEAFKAAADQLESLFSEDFIFDFK
ncbi:MAG: hypothetical protein LBP22_17155 [Deltaproteobacteria bacterium]|jgi:hypothetical protein|nr:hypothetical protein [Deltaproteobacteria bacterium]